MAVGISEMRRPQLVAPVGGDRPQLHLEGHPSCHELVVGGAHVVDLEHDLGEGLVVWPSLNLIEGELDTITGEEGEGTAPGGWLEPHLLGPECDRLVEVGHPQDDPSYTHPEEATRPWGW